MINLANVTELVLSDNILHNFGNTGFVGAIQINTGSVVSCDNNTYRNFSKTSNYSINFSSVSKLIVTNNIFHNVYRPFYSNACNQVLFSKNICEANTSGGSSFVDLNSSNFIISDNIFKSLATINSASLVNIVSSGSNYILANNIFTHSHTTTSTHQLLTASGFSKANMYGNIFIGGTDYSVQPINLTLTDSVFFNNNLRDLFGKYLSGNDLISTNSTTIDRDNLGQEYKIALSPAQCASFKTDFVAAQNSGYYAYSVLEQPNNIRFSTQNYGFLIFSSGRDIPIGAKLSNVKVGYDNPTTGTNLKMRLMEIKSATYYGGGGGSYLTPLTDTTAGGHLITLTPTTTVAEANQIYYVYFEVNGDFANVSIYGMDVTYIL
jgi:hypothetical protein